MGGFMGPVAQKLVNLEKAEDAAHTTADKGIMALAVRKDTAAALASTDGDYIPLIVDDTGQLWVNIAEVLGVTAKGQATMANSLPVTFASNQAGLAQLPAALGQAASAASTSVVIANDQDFVKAEDAVHSTADKGIMALGVRKDAAAALAGTDGDYIPLITDASGRAWVNVGSLIGVTAAGQAAMAASVPVAIASNQTVIPVNDNSGALTIDSAQLPAALGQTTMANSMSVVLASDSSGAVIAVKDQVTLTYGVVDGANGTGNYDGVTTDWRAIRGANELPATDILNTTANVGKYFDGDNAAFDADPVWAYIPINSGGYTKWAATIYNALGVNLVVTLYAVAKNALWTSITAVGNGKSVADSILYYQIATETLATGATGIYGTGGAFPNMNDWPIGFLLIKADPASDPGAGTYWRMGIVRQGPGLASLPE